MAEFIGTRDHKKCRSHHQKMHSKRTVEETIHYIKEKFKTGQAENAEETDSMTLSSASPREQMDEFENFLPMQEEDPQRFEIKNWEESWWMCISF